MERKDFWTEVFMLRGSVTPIVISRVVAFSFVALLVALGNNYFSHEVSLGVGHYEVVGVVLALLLVLRTNSGYDRYLFVLPFALVDKSGLLTPLITALVAYPLLALDQIGIELQNPFSENQLSHLPLADICQTIEDNDLALDIGDPYEAHDRGILPLSISEHEDVVMSASYDSPAPPVS